MLRRISKNVCLAARYFSTAHLIINDGNKATVHPQKQATVSESGAVKESHLTDLSKRNHQNVVNIKAN